MNTEEQEISLEQIRVAFIEFLREHLNPPTGMQMGGVEVRDTLQIASIQNGIATKVLGRGRSTDQINFGYGHQVSMGQQLSLNDAGKDEITRLIWNMITQGKMVPGSGSSYDLPWLTITQSGAKWLENDGSEPILFFSSEEYLSRLQSQGITLGEITQSYVDEAIRSYFNGCPKSSMVMIGVAMEALFDEIDEAIRNTAIEGWVDINLRDRGMPYSRRLKQFEGAIRNLNQDLVSISGVENPQFFLVPIFEHVRQMRNDGAHPKLPNHDLNQAFALLELFSRVATIMVKLRNHLSTE